MKLIIKYIFIAIGIILFDLAVYILLGLLLMDYEDFYDESQGEIWSLGSMTFWQQVNYIGLNLWHLINLIFICYLIYKIFINVKKGKTLKSTKLEEYK